MLTDTLAIVIGLIAGAIAFAALNRAPATTTAPRTTLAFLSTLLALTTTLTLHDAQLKTPIEWNSVRTAIPYALAHGLPIYAHNGQGPLWCNIYPPLGHLLYTPVALASTPTNAIRIGQLLSLAWLVIPFALLCATLAQRKTLGAITGATIALTGIAFLGQTPIADVALFVHVDSPAIGLILLAIAALWRQPNPARPVLAGVLLAGALFTKQSMLGAAALLIAISFVHHRSALPRLLASLAATLALLTAASAAAFGAPTLWHSIITVPSKHEFPGGFTDALIAALRDYFTYFAPLLATYALLLWTTRSPRVTLLGVIALAQLPLALLGAMKFGGGPNNYALSGLFLLAGIAVALTHLLQHNSHPRLTTALLSLALATSLLTTLRTPPLPTTPSPHDLSFALLKNSPTQYYFPWLPLSHLIATGHQTHHSWGLLDRVMANEDPNESWFRKYIPPTATTLCYKDPPDRLSLIYLRLRTQYPTPANVPTLEGWSCYTTPPPP